MTAVRYSQLANSDIEEIAAFTVERWGEDQAQTYISELRRVCRLISDQPHLGRRFTEKRPTWLRFEHESHVILYSAAAGGITVQRILHKRRLMPHL